MRLPNSVTTTKLEETNNPDKWGTEHLWRVNQNSNYSRSGNDKPTLISLGYISTMHY